MELFTSLYSTIDTLNFDECSRLMQSDTFINTYEPNENALYEFINRILYIANDLAKLDEYVIYVGQLIKSVNRGIFLRILLEDDSIMYSLSLEILHEKLEEVIRAFYPDLVRTLIEKEDIVEKNDMYEMLVGTYQDIIQSWDDDCMMTVPSFIEMCHKIDYSKNIEFPDVIKYYFKSLTFQDIEIVIKAHYEQPYIYKFINLFTCFYFTDGLLPIELLSAGAVLKLDPEILIHCDMAKAKQIQINTSQMISSQELIYLMDNNKTASDAPETTLRWHINYNNVMALLYFDDLGWQYGILLEMFQKEKLHPKYVDYDTELVQLCGRFSHIFPQDAREAITHHAEKVIDLGVLSVFYFNLSINMLLPNEMIFINDCLGFAVDNNYKIINYEYITKNIVFALDCINISDFLCLLVHIDASFVKRCIQCLIDMKKLDKLSLVCLKLLETNPDIKKLINPDPPKTIYISTKCDICCECEEMIIIPCGHCICKICSFQINKCPFCKISFKHDDIVAVVWKQ